MGVNMNNLTASRNSATWRRGKTATTALLTPDLLSRELWDVDPIREGTAYPRQRNYHGYYWMAATNNHVWHESLLERDWMMWLDFSSDVVGISSQPVMLTDSEGKPRYPDLLALDTRGIQTVYDVKPAARINDKVRAQFEWTRGVCEHVGWDYRVLTDIPKQYKVNLHWLSYFRHPGYGPRSIDTAEFLDMVTPSWTLGDAVDAMPAPSTARARSEVFHLLWTGALTCNMNARLSNRTPIHAGVGRTTIQELPNVA